ncbi:hypothetical protein Mgra_00004620 [Meloidogyne graminicola]|uniref:Uncharacterized protein n=1 Tax=Meloidogyne graminicola TaxID=189291 RepID=A0A8S9ZR42_9BILA|nr:hypothetical protein Mgra_00004620 [Meloidogyne graminicola]
MTPQYYIDVNPHCSRPLLSNKKLILNFFIYEIHMIDAFIKKKKKFKGNLMVLTLLLFVFHFGIVLSSIQTKNELEVYAHNIAALTSCHLNFLENGTLEGSINVIDPYIKIQTFIPSCIDQFFNNNNENKINKGKENNLKIIYEFIDKEIDNEQFLKLKTKIMYFGWILQMLYYTVADKFLEKLLNSDNFERELIFSKIKIDKNLYKNFRKNHLHRIIENFDNLLELNDETTTSITTPPLSPNKKIVVNNELNEGKEEIKLIENIPSVNKVLLLINGTDIDYEGNRIIKNSNNNNNNEILEFNKNSIKKLKNLIEIMPISHILSSTDSQPSETVKKLVSSFKNMEIKYDQGFNKKNQNEENKIFKEHYNKENGYKLNKKEQIYFAQKLTKIFNKINKTGNSFDKFLEQNDKNNTVYLVIVVNSQVIGVIHELITGQWTNIEPWSISKFVEFKNKNNENKEEITFKNLRLIRSNDQFCLLIPFVINQGYHDTYNKDQFIKKRRLKWLNFLRGINFNTCGGGVAGANEN